jgi:hypothetical protein
MPARAAAGRGGARIAYPDINIRANQGANQAGQINSVDDFR